MSKACEFCVINLSMAENFQFKMTFVIPKERCVSYLKMGDDILLQWQCPKSRSIQTVIVEDRWNEETFTHKTDDIPLRTSVAAIYRGNALSAKRKAELMSAPTQQVIPEEPAYEAFSDDYDLEFDDLIHDDGESLPLDFSHASLPLPV
jgi:hypothetical protein